MNALIIYDALLTIIIKQIHIKLIPRLYSQYIKIHTLHT